MTINDLMQSTSVSNADKTNLFKSIMPTEFEYSVDTQEVVITSPAKDVKFSYEMKNGKLLINYIKGSTKIQQWENDPYNYSENVVKVVGRKLVTIAKAFDATLVGDSEINDFQSLIENTIARISPDATSNILVEFRNEEVDFNDAVKKYTNFSLSETREGKWISKNYDELDVNLILKNKLTVIPETSTETPNTPVVVDDTDLMDLI